MSVSEETALPALIERYDEILIEARRRLNLPITEPPGSGYTAAAALLIHNQVRWFDRDLGRDTKQAVGFVKDFLVAVAANVYRSASFETFSWQPMPGPVGAAAYLKNCAGTDVVTMVGKLDVPEVRLDVVLDKVSLPDFDNLPEGAALDEVRVTASAAFDLNAVADVVNKFGREAQYDMLHCGVDELFAAYERQAVAAVLSLKTEEPEKVDLSDENAALSNLIHKSMQIFQKTQRGAANFLIVGPEVMTTINKWASWETRKDANTPIKALHRLHKVGYVDRRFRVYMDPFFPGRKVIMGYAGPSLIDTGLVMSPYMFTIVEGKLRLRSAFKIVLPDFFKVIEC